MTSIDDFSTGVALLAAALNAATSDPADALRLLAQLADFAPTTICGTDPIGAAMSAMADACGDLFRRNAVIALAQATTTYEPSSSNDAFNAMNAVTALLDEEIEIAGDQFEDDTFATLRALREAVVADLTARGANLAPVITFSFPESLPAYALAGRIYDDVTRADQLIAQVDPIHPLFMPQTFDALGS